MVTPTDKEPPCKSNGAILAEAQDAYAGLGFRTTALRDPRPQRAAAVFRLDAAEVPERWSQVAADVIAQKYFRKAGVPARLKKIREKDVPEFLWRSVADEAALAELPEAERHVGETSARQVFDRLAGAWAYWGWKGGYFTERGRRAHLLRRDAPHARRPDRGAQLAAMVQHRAPLGLWHRRAGAGALLRRLENRQAHPQHLLLRAPAAARLLHPVRRRRLW